MLRLGGASLSRCARHAHQRTAAAWLCGDRQNAQRSCRCASTTLQTSDVLAQVESEVGPLSRKPMVPAQKPVVLVVSGPSGVGKDSIVQRLHEIRSDLHFVVTATTRPMRAGERDGVDYHFVTKERFQAWIAEDALLEHAVVYGQYKGIPRQQVVDALDRGCDVVLRLDVQGAATVRRLLPDVVSVFVVAQTEEELVRRLVERKTEEADALVRRVATIKQECARIGEFEYVVVNSAGGLDRAAQELSAIIDAERCRTDRRGRHTGPSAAPAL